MYPHYPHHLSLILNLVKMWRLCVDFLFFTLFFSTTTSSATKLIELKTGALVQLTLTSELEWSSGLM
jgi:hypothetical protein